MSTKFDFLISTPEAQGVPSAAITEFIDEVEKEHIGVNSLIIMRHGHIVAEGYWAPFAMNKPHRLFSAGKAVMSTAILFAMQEGLLSVDSLMTDLMPEDMPAEISPRLKKLNLYHLLTMTTGHATDTFGPMLAPGTDRPKKFFELPLEFEPGTHFLYNNGVPDMLQFILYKITGQSVYEYLKPRLFEPLHMSNLRADKNGALEELPTMAFETRDLFKLALFYSQGGTWEGKQLLREDLVCEASRYHVPSSMSGGDEISDHNSGYCWQMWRNKVGGFRIDGGQGQYGVVLPEADIVIGINSNEMHQMVVLKVLWEKITSKLYARPLDANPDAYEALQVKLARLSWAPSALVTPSCNWQGSYRLSEPLLGREITTFGGTDRLLTIFADIHPISIKTDGSWTSCEVPFLVPELATALPKDAATPSGIPLRHDLVAGADAAQCVAALSWTASDTLELHLRSDGWMGFHTFVFAFSENGLVITYENGISYNTHRRSDKYMNELFRKSPFIKEPEKITTEKLTNDIRI